MIKTLITVTALTLTGLLSAPRAEAGHSHNSITYQSGFTSCGSPIYTRRYVRGYDRCGRPVFGYVRVPVTRAYRHQASSYRPRPVISRPVISRAIPCAPRRVSLSTHRALGRSSGVSLSFSFGGRRCR